MPKLRDQMAAALASAAVAAVEQGRASDLSTPSEAPAAEPVRLLPDPEPARIEPPVGQAPTEADALAEALDAETAPVDALAALDRPKLTQQGDLVQFGFRCPRDLKREVERFCFEREVTLQEFGQTALRLLLDEMARRHPGAD